MSARRLLLVFILPVAASFVARGQQDTGAEQTLPAAPNLVPSSSYISLDGLSLVISFDKPANLSDSLEASERRKLILAEPEEELSRTIHLHLSSSQQQQHQHERLQLAEQTDSTCPATTTINEVLASNNNNQLIQGILLCAKLLTRKTLKLLHKYRLHNCAWSTQLQFIIQLGKPASGPLRVAFQQSALTGLASELTPNLAEEIGLQLNRLPLEGLGLPLAPRLALTGPNQVPSCGQFTLSGHLWSPFGVSPGESVSLSWSVERASSNLLQSSHTLSQLANATGSSSTGEVVGALEAQMLQQQRQQAAENIKWQRLQELVAANKANNLVLDADLLQLSPQQYQFHLSVSFTTSLTTISLNATHKLSKLDYETPIGSLFGSHLLSAQPQVNTNRDLVLLADVRIPDCASDIKQVGMYWQVSDPRVRFEQTYAPIYLARARSLPEQASLEMRLNLFYGIRVKRYSSANTQLITGDAQLEATISDGFLAMSVGLKQTNQASPGYQSEQNSDWQTLGSGVAMPSNQQQSLELFASLESSESDKYSYQWSCFDGKTGQACTRRDPDAPTRAQASNDTTSTPLQPVGPMKAGAQSGQQAPSGKPAPPPLIDRQRQVQSVLKLPFEWLQANSQLWIGLQRYDRRHLNAVHQQPQQQQHQQAVASSEYILVSVDDDSSGQLSIGPILIGHHRTPLSFRNPLTGAMLLPSGVPIVLVGRVFAPPETIRSISWHSSDFMYQLDWTRRNATNPLTGRPELATELHLKPNLLIPNAHYQFQLSACSSSGHLGSVSLRVDMVGGISQCRVEVSQSKQGSALLVSVDFCNIPLDLSPVTYQLYAVETGEPLANESKNNNRRQDGASSNNDAKKPLETDYLNEQDEHQLAEQMRPLTVAQLTPSFHLASSQALALLASHEPAAGQLLGHVDDTDTADSRRVVVRFGARVCDRLQACRMFYSEPFALEPRATSGEPAAVSGTAGAGTGASRDQLKRSQRLQERRDSQLRLSGSLRSLIDSARRQNLAGNSIAAVSLLSSAIDLGQKLLLSSGLAFNPLLLQSSGSVTSQAAAAAMLAKQQQQQQPDVLIGQASDRARDLLQVAVRDCLHYCSVSLQRPLHYTDSGQANVVTETLAHLMSLEAPLVSPWHEFEIKFKSAHLLALASRRTIAEQVSLRVARCIADFKSLQTAYESLFGAFDNQHHLEAAPTDHQAGGTNRTSSSSSSSSSSVASNKQWFHSLNLNSFLLASQAAGGRNNQSAHSLPRAQYLSSASASTTAGITQKKRDNTILSYLWTLRQAYRALLAAGAAQLSLGEQQVFRYATRGFNGSQAEPFAAAASSGAIGQEANNKQQPAEPLDVAQQQQQRATLMSPSTGTGEQQNLLPANPEQQFFAPADIVSSLKHLNGLPSEPIDIDLQQFGSVSLRLAQRFVAKFRQQLDNANIRCQNDSISSSGHAFASPVSSLSNNNNYRQQSEAKTTTGEINGSAKCATVVLAVTSFAGKAPFRALDQGLTLRLPIIEVALLSPIDGSNLLELMQANLVAELEVSATFSLPDQVSGDSRKTLKCYHFDETQNEWLAHKRDLANELADNQLSCSYSNVLGPFTAFQGQPPAKETPLSLFILLGLTVTLALVVVLSIISCFASDRKTSRSEVADTSEDSSSRDLGPVHYHHHHHQEQEQQQHKIRRLEHEFAPHPEQNTHRVAKKRAAL